MVEMGFVVYRRLLPVPVWLGFYSKDSDYFAAVYLVLKVTTSPPPQTAFALVCPLDCPRRPP